MAKRKMSTFERLNTGQMNRSQRRELGRRVAASDPGLTIVHPGAGGIDVGNESHLWPCLRIGMRIRCGNLVVGRQP